MCVFCCLSAPQFWAVYQRQTNKMSALILTERTPTLQTAIVTTSAPRDYLPWSTVEVIESLMKRLNIVSWNTLVSLSARKVKTIIFLLTLGNSHKYVICTIYVASATEFPLEEPEEECQAIDGSKCVFPYSRGELSYNFCWRNTSSVSFCETEDQTFLECSPSCNDKSMLKPGQWLSSASRLMFVV